MAKVIEIKEESKLSLKVKCGSCIHLNKLPFYDKKPCVEHGKITGSMACKSYQPDYSILSALGTEFYSTLGPLLKGVNKTQSNALAYLFRNLETLNKKGLRFGLPVAFSLTGKNYLNSYFKGYVIGMAADGDTVHVVSSLTKTSKKDTLVSVPKFCLLNKAQFIKLREKLVKEGAIEEPRKASKDNLLDFLKMSKKEYTKYKRKLSLTPSAYTPPSIDSVDPSWWNTTTSKSLDVRAVLDKPKVKKKPKSDIKLSATTRISSKKNK